MGDTNRIDELRANKEARVAALFASIEGWREEVEACLKRVEAQDRKYKANSNYGKF